MPSAPLTWPCPSITQNICRIGAGCCQEPSWLQSNAPNLPRSLKTHHSTEGGPVASVSLDRFAGAESVVQDLHGAFIASAPVRR